MKTMRDHLVSKSAPSPSSHPPSTYSSNLVEPMNRIRSTHYDSTISADSWTFTAFFKLGANETSVRIAYGRTSTPIVCPRLELPVSQETVMVIPTQEDTAAEMIPIITDASLLRIDRGPARPVDDAMVVDHLAEVGRLVADPVAGTMVVTAMTIVQIAANDAAEQHLPNLGAILVVASLVSPRTCPISTDLRVVGAT